jgi:hypothetical protein
MSSSRAAGVEPTRSEAHCPARAVSDESRPSEKAKRAVFSRFRRNGIVSKGQGDAIGKRHVPAARQRWMRGATTGVAVGLTVASWLRAADSEPDAQSSADVVAAQALFERGRELMARRRIGEACLLFEESQRLDAGVGTQFNLAVCYEAAGRFASAYTSFLEVAAAARARDQLQRAEVAAERARRVESKLSRLIIEVEPKQRVALRLERDGSLVGPAQWGLAVPVDPGVHDVRAGGEGLVPWARQVEVGTSPVVYTVRVPVLPLAARDPEPCDPISGHGCDPPDRAARHPESQGLPLQQTLGFAALGVGAAGLGLGVGFAIHAYSKNQDAEDAGCNGGGCPDGASLNLRRQAVSAGNWATVGTGVGLAGLATAGVLFWMLPDGGRSEVATVVPRWTADVAGIDVCGEF